MKLIFHEIFLLSVRVPKFSDQAGTSRDEIIAKLIRFDVLDAVSTLRKIFPAGKIKTTNSGFSDKSLYVVCVIPFLKAQFDTVSNSIASLSI